MADRTTDVKHVRIHSDSTSSLLTSQTLPPELMTEAARRLPWLGLLFSVSYLLNRIGQRLVMDLTGTVLPGRSIQDAFDVAAIMLGIAVFVLARSTVLSPGQKLHLASAFLVTGAFAIALTEFWLGFPIEFVSTSPLIPAECAWIIAFPLVVPNTPRRTLVSSLLAASMGPAALAVSATVNGFVIERPWLYATYFLSTNYVCAFFAYPVSLIVYRFGKRLRHAREIGSYEMLDRIGEGGMGQVWRARHRLLARPAAIKLIRTELLGSSAGLVNDTIRRFEREAQETAKLGSVHTIDVYDYGVTQDGDFYYVMELLNGISLERYVKQFGPMAPGRVVYLMRQVCHSLSEAHERGLIHRDIKPANIFMCRLGPDDDFVKVLDFGLVKQFGDRGAGTMPTIEELTAGTPAFMAPEIALNDNSIDGRADIYALGCVAYYLLTGETVFPNESAIAVMLAHVKDTPLPPSLRSKFDVPATLDTLILECLDKDKESRPRSADVLAKRLAECVPTHSWNANTARLWWQAHQPGVVERRDGEHEASAAPTESRRCWPCLAHKARALSDAR
jgi:eukaryotic-like serine/threonine-protein kinase